MGDEYDTVRLGEIREVLLNLGATEAGRWSDGLGDFNQVMYSLGGSELLCEWELYMGISLIGPEDVLALVLRCLSAKA